MNDKISFTDWFKELWKMDKIRVNPIVLTYPEAARVIALYLDPFCDRKLPYSNMIAEASRKASEEILALTSRVAVAEGANEELKAKNKRLEDLTEKMLLLITKHGIQQSEEIIEALKDGE